MQCKRLGERWNRDKRAYAFVDLVVEEDDVLLAVDVVPCGGQQRRGGDVLVDLVPLVDDVAEAGLVSDALGDHGANDTA